MTTEIPLGSVALSLAAAGFAVFPLLTASKEPATRRGFKSSTRDATRIRAWWDTNPRFNVGIDCGGSGIVVLDFDPLPDAGEGVETGLDHLLAIADGLGVARDWLWRGHQVVTPRGGFHHYYRTPAERPIRCSAGKVAPGIDVRAAGGYTVAPWSQRPDGAYRPYLGWEHRVDGLTDLAAVTAATMTQLDFTVADLPVLPDWLADLCDPPPTPVDPLERLHRQLDVQRTGQGGGYGRAALASESETVSGASVGHRNKTLFQAACRMGQLAAAGLLSERDVTVELDRAAERAGLPERERATTIRSGLRYGQDNPREVRLR